MIIAHDNYFIITMDGLVFIACLVCFCLSCRCIKGVTIDPCVHHSTFDEDSIGSRNEKCSRPSPAQRLCDYRLNPGWYSIPHNGFLLNKCPTSGECGTEFPVWMRGNVPSVTEGIVNRTGCIQQRCDCCAGNVTIQVKNCTSKLVVYYLPTLEYCDSVYCMSTSLPCETTTTTIKTTTVAPRSSLATTTAPPTTTICPECSDCVSCIKVCIPICVGMFCSGGAIGFAVSSLCNRYTCHRRPSSRIGNSGADVSPCKPNTPPPPYDTRLNNVHGGQQ